MRNEICKWENINNISMYNNKSMKCIMANVISILMSKKII